MAAEEDLENDCILVQTDCTFNIALTVLRSLSNDETQVCSSKVVYIENIESNDPCVGCSLRFGGGGDQPFRKRLQCFARTASSVLRMMMLESVNASRWCPTIGPQSGPRNKKKMRLLQSYVQPGHREFAIAATKSAAEDYYTYYDQLHPHFKIEKEFLSAQPADDGWWYMRNMMLIFRRDFTEVIEIGTSLQVGHRPYAWPWTGPGTFHSKAHVRCIVRSISNPNHDGLRFLRVLKNTSSYQEECFTLAWLLGQIAQRLRIQPRQEEEEEEEEEDDNDENEEDAQIPAQMQGNHHQPYNIAPWTVPQQIPQAPLIQGMRNHQPHAAPVPQQIPTAPLIQGNHQPHAAPVPQQIPTAPLNIIQGNHQPHAALVPQVLTAPLIQGNHQPHVAPVQPQNLMHVQGNYQPNAAPVPPPWPAHVQVQRNHGLPYGAPVQPQMLGGNYQFAQAPPL